MLTLITVVIILMIDWWDIFKSKSLNGISCGSSSDVGLRYLGLGVQHPWINHGYED
jgi:hypothetical protein